MVRSALRAAIAFGRLTSRRSTRPGRLRALRCERELCAQPTVVRLHRDQLIVCRTKLPGSTVVGRAVGVEFRPRPVELALSRLVPSTFGPSGRVRLGERLEGGDKVSLRPPAAIDGSRQLVAIDERRFELCWFLLTPLPSPVRPHTIGVRPPLPWPPSLARDRHESIVTKRNDSVHQPVNGR